MLDQASYPIYPMSELKPLFYGRYLQCILQFAILINLVVMKEIYLFYKLPWLPYFC